MKITRTRYFVAVGIVAIVCGVLSFCVGETFGVPCSPEKCGETRYSWGSIPACSGTGATNSLFLDPNDGCFYRCGGDQVFCPNSGPATDLACTSCVSLTAEVTGTLPLANGGTNQTSWTANRCVQVNAAGTALEVYGSGCGGAAGAGGSNTEVQFNSSGSLAGDATFTFDAGTDTLTVSDLDCSACIDVSTEVTGTTPVGNGGTGLAASVEDSVMVGSGTTTWEAKVVPDCLIGSNGILNYNNSTNAFSCGTLQAYQNVQDEGSPLTARSTLNLAGSGIVCLDDTTKTTCTVAGNLAPGGSNGHVQFADTGAFNGEAGLSYNKTTDATTIAKINGEVQTSTFADIATALAALPTCSASVPCVMRVDAAEAETTGTTKFVDANPATASAGKQDAAVIDTRNGGVRFLSSMGEYPIGQPGALEAKVPFVFQVRLNDDTKPYKDADGDQVLDVGAINEWTCGRDVGNCSVTTGTKCTNDAECPGGETCTNWSGTTDEWKNCPNGNSSWGAAASGGTRQYWYSGQCNVASGTIMGTSGTCSGSHILEVRYPQNTSAPVAHESKPIFAVGAGGAAIYEPDTISDYWYSYLTMFRGNDPNSAGSSKRNTPMFAFTRHGLFADGGMFVGNTLSFPFFVNDTYQQFNMFIQSDISSSYAPLAVEGTTDAALAGETSPIVTLWDSSGKGGTTHPGSRLKAFEFQSNSVMTMASKCDSDADGCTGTVDDSQYIEWEGMTADDYETRLTVTEPTADRNVKLPNATGTVMLDSSTVALAQIADDATSGKCLLSGGAGGDPAWTTCPGGVSQATVCGYAWPVNSTYISIEGSCATNPSTTLGCGTWSLIGAGKALVGRDSGDTDFDTVEETGGAKTVAAAGSVSAPTISGNTANEATHTHSVTSNVAVADHASHTHNVNASGASAVKVGTSTSNAEPTGHTHVTAGPSATLTHSVTNNAVTSGAGASHNHGATGLSNSTPTFTGSATSVVQPYIVVCIWKRTA